ncbi:amidohydrolase family protein [Staphylococcus kloosii]|uniref:amidohydrolase family protein n=1 Tax=Staphylococcus kloosii TaxID=29384 RepID=UPI0028A48ECF|nr:amidohydrolase family protein [Staphylococcus kloosii]MDT3958497.1 amidohydrolase family protein [Staphylococcus kloosii]
MNSITFEEHFVLKEVRQQMGDALKPSPNGVPLNAMLEALEKETGFSNEDEINNHDQRIQFMDEQDVKMQVLSYGNGSPSLLKGAKAIELCQYTNDRLKQYIDEHTDRFLGFATLPINEPEAAATELKRCINELGFKGALIFGRPNGKFLDNPEFEVIFATAEQLDVPIYLHPAPISDAAYQAYYQSDNYSDATAATFASFGYGWHIDVGIHAMRLVLSGLFDRHPNLSMIIGHWGEFTPFFYERMDNVIHAPNLDHDPSYYFKTNFYITPSGMLTKPQFNMVKNAVGIDHILYSADYPYVKPENLGTFLAELGLTSEEQDKVNYKNAEKLLKLK